MLGKDVVKVFSEKTTFEIFGLSRKCTQIADSYHHIVVDLTDTVSLEGILRDIKPRIVVHCAANVSVDDCESNKKYAYELHVNSTDTLASHNPSRTTFVYISTDSVYNGKNSNHSELEATLPANYYALTKLEGEMRTQKRNPNAVIIRTNIFGFQKQVGTSLVDWALRNLSQHLPIYGFADVFFNPIYSKQLARLIHSVINVDFKGILNIGSDSILSKYDFLVRLCEKFGFSTDLVRKRSIEHQRFEAQRPKNTTMDVNRLKGIVGQVPDLLSGLKEMKSDWHAG
jgi:dTDP-4-dehydrorhamnose reductase